MRALINMYNEKNEQMDDKTAESGYPDKKS